MIDRINRKREEQGFTLIELLIVIIILAILAAIVVFAIGATRKDSVTSSCKTDLKSIELSAEAVNTKTGSYPVAAGVGGQTNLLAPATGALLKTWPGGGNDYTFTYSTTATGYQVAVSQNQKVDGGNFDGTNLDVVCKGN